MSPTETVYAFAPLLLALAILFAFKRKRRQTADYTESVAVKVALPAWVKNVEFLIFVMFLAMITMGTFDIFVLLLGHSYVSGSLKGHLRSIYRSELEALEYQLPFYVLI